MPLKDIPQALRGVFAAPQGFREEGATGVVKAFADPAPYERSNRVRGAQQSNLDEEKQIDQIIEGAQDVADLAPAIGLFQKLQGEAYASGLIEDEQAYKRVLGPLQQRLAGAARRIALGSATDESGLAGQLSKASVVTGDPALATQANTLQEVMRRRQSGAAAEKRGAYYDEAAASDTELRPLRADAQRALAEQRRRGDAGGSAGGPKLTDLDRVRGQIDTQTRDPYGGGSNPDAAPSQASMAEYNRRAETMNRPPLFHSPGAGVSELTGGADQVARTLGAVAGQPAAGGYAPPPLEDPQAPGLEAAPPAQRIQIPDQFRQRAASPNPQHALSTRELIAYYQQQGLPQAQAIQAAREAAWELSGAAGR